jgi:hypothetical protein
MAEPKSTSENVETPKSPEAPVIEPKTDQKDEEQEDDWKARVEKIAQSAADKVRTEYAKKLKDAQKEIELLRTEKMSENEKREYEAQKLKEALEAKERDLTYREMELLAVKALEEKKLPSTFLEFVIGDNKDKTLERIAQLEKTFSDEKKSAVAEAMKAHGRDPNRGRTGDVTSGFEGMTPKEIEMKARGDPDWWRQNEDAIMEHYKGGYKR